LSTICLINLRVVLLFIQALRPMKSSYFFIFLLCASTAIAPAQSPTNVLSAAVAGKAFLQGQTDHSGITILFLAQSSNAKTDSTTTNMAGLYNIALVAGNYFIKFYKYGYYPNNYYGLQSFIRKDTLDDIPLFPKITTRAIAGQMFFHPLSPQVAFDSSLTAAMIHFKMKVVVHPPEYFLIEQNFPNPFNLVTTFRYQLPVTSRVKLQIYDLLGRAVATLEDGIQPAGYKQVEWNAGILDSGVYIYRFEATNYIELKKMLLIH